MLARQDRGRVWLPSGRWVRQAPWAVAAQEARDFIGEVAENAIDVFVLEQDFQYRP